MIRIRNYHALWLTFPDYSTLLSSPDVAVLLPPLCLNIMGLGSSAFARHYLRNHFCFLLLGVLRCFSSPRSPHPIGDGTSTAAGGFPHSEIPGSSRICRSPGLIAAYHVLLRLHEPRYPPFALLSFLLYSWYLNDTEIRFSFSSSFQHVKDHWPFFWPCGE